MNPLLAGLGFTDPATEREWGALVAGESGFAWRHLGRGEIRTGQAVEAIRAAGTTPPRSGHIGDWGDVWTGRSTVLDYNRVVCEILKIGYPLLYDFSQTETSDGAGDALFQPGSVFDGGVRTAINLFRWQAGRFVEHDRSQPLFVPYTEGGSGAERLPLTAFHRARTQRQGIADVGYHSQLLRANYGAAHSILTVLSDRASGDAALRQIFDRVAFRDGHIERQAPLREGRGFRVGVTYYPDLAALIDASLLPAWIAGADEELGDWLAQTPECVPLATVEVASLLHAFLGAHRTERRPVGTGEAEVHMHWGALAMAGSPPVSRGYFARRVNKSRWMYDTVARELAWASPIFFVLAPVSPYFLWLPQSRVAERAAIETLIERTRAACGPWPPEPGRLVPIVAGVVENWIAEREPSRYLVARFQWADRTSPVGVALGASELVEPDGFSALTISQACLLVGTLVKAMAARPASGVGTSAIDAQASA
ncbi:DUF6025 family protein [Nocardia sp. NPDC046763]|uniref:DUF6025 family protein n=1 Tax=Nocardia sp. NPDC046763 TaxID=3155256 RepID=UPI0033D11CD7